MCSAAAVLLSLSVVHTACYTDAENERLCMCVLAFVQREVGGCLTLELRGKVTVERSPVSAAICWLEPHRDRVLHIRLERRKR